ncbi:uncharacterized protein VTP21DRAFT_9177 [Calcarisporiella thermophila]|uniref:uncharacterized protein n=1 Tax=Calcarisporiella thermophila TaxID=911321 RepID=UPI0037439D66
MYPAIFSRAALRSRALTRPLRSDLYHFENTNGQNLPFSTKNKPLLAVGVVTFFGVGFGLPFFNAWWTLKKNAGAAE